MNMNIWVDYIYLDSHERQMFANGFNWNKIKFRILVSKFYYLEYLNSEFDKTFN
jgi:hypothetical protein